MTNDQIIQQAGTEWNKTRGTMNDYLATVIRIARKDEREACAETAMCFVNGGQEIAEAIRARGNDGSKP